MKTGLLKKTVLLLSACLFIFSVSVHAQICFEEDFERVQLSGQTGDLPEGWVLYNDNNRPNQEFSYCNQAWKIRLVSGNKVAVSPSWFTSANARADRWMVTPVIDLKGTVAPALDFTARSYDAGERESYLVMVSTTDSAKTSFTDTILNVSNESGSWVERVADLSAYAGKSIRLAFVQRSKDRYALYIDNIRVQDLKRPHVDLSSLLCPSKVSPDTAFGLSAKARMIASEEVTSYTVAYRFALMENPSQTVFEGTKTVALQAKESPQLGVRAFDVESPVLSLSEEGSYEVAFWMTSVNDGKQIESDTLYASIEVSLQGYFQRNTLLELFSSSTCSPCAKANPWIKKAYEAVYAGEQASLLSVIKYQMNIPAPGDPCVIDEGLYKFQLYGGSGVPAMYLNGVKRTSADGWENFENELPMIIEREFSKSTPLGIEAQMTREGNLFTVNVNLTNVIAYENAVLYVVFTEDSLSHPAQSNGETEFFHVARKVLPSAYGEELELRASGTNTYTYSYTFDGQKPRIFAGLNGLSAVVYVQDKESLEVLQSVHLPAIESTVANRSMELADGRVNLSPNPARNHCRLSMELRTGGDVSVDILDLQGRVCQKTQFAFLQPGINVMDISTEGLLKGCYFVRISTPAGVVIKKLIVC